MEYIVSIISLLVILLSLYVVVVDMDLRRSLFVSQMEGDRVSQRLAAAVDEMAVAGPGSRVTLFLGAHPNQSIRVGGQQVIAIGNDNRTVSIASAPGSNLSLANLSTNQAVSVYNNGTHILLSGQGAGS